MLQSELLGYCKFRSTLDDSHVHAVYHDVEYGFPIHDDDLLFARLVLEINQAGLSWSTILNKKDNFFAAFDGFSIAKVSQYAEKDIQRLLNNAGIIRNRLKINAAIYNAQQILTLQQEYGSFEAWLNANHPLSREEWVKVFKKKFKFVGGEIVNEFLMSTGYLKGAHCSACPCYQKQLKMNVKCFEK